jgi:hypothetical protein
VVNNQASRAQPLCLQWTVCVRVTHALLAFCCPLVLMSAGVNVSAQDCHGNCIPISTAKGCDLLMHQLKGGCMLSGKWSTINAACLNLFARLDTIIPRRAPGNFHGEHEACMVKRKIVGFASLVMFPQACRLAASACGLCRWTTKFEELSHAGAIPPAVESVRLSCGS